MQKSASILALALLFTVPAVAEPVERMTSTLLRQTENEMEITVQNTPNGLELELTGLPAGTEPAVFALRKPPQLIVDLPATISQQFRHMVVKHSDLYSLRYGMRKGKTRFIFDFRSTETPQFQILAPNDTAPVRIRFATRNLVRDVVEAPKIAEKTATPADKIAAEPAVVSPAEPKKATRPDPVPSDLANLDAAAARRRFVDVEDPANVVLSPTILFIFGCSIMSLLTVLVLHRKKYGVKQVPVRPANPFEDLDYCYALLGIEREAAFSEVKSSYRQLAKRYHSDRLVAEGGNIVQIRSAEAQFHKLQQAYERIKRARGIN